MSQADSQVLGQHNRAVDREQDRAREYAKQAAIVIAASLFVALCARVSVPLPFTPVPLTLQNFGVLAVGLLLGSRRGFAALALYLLEGAVGLPVFSPSLVLGVRDRSPARPDWRIPAGLSAGGFRRGLHL